MNPPLTTTPGPQVPPGLDPKAYILTKALAYQEGGGSVLAPNAPGQSGEVGIYQYEPSTWDARAKQFLGADAPSIQDATPEQQNEVTYKWVNSMLNTVNPKTGTNYTPAEVASMHNAGQGNPDAWRGNAGTNSSGVQFDTKAYVTNVQKYAEQLYGGIDPATGKPQTASAGYGYVTPPTPPTPAVTGGGMQPATQAGAPRTSFGTPQPDPNVPDPGHASFANLGYNLSKAPGELGDLAGKLLPILPDLLKDIQGKNDKTVLQQVGDAGMSALWFLPFGELAEGIGLGAEALGLGAGAAKTAGLIGAGAVGGYGSDVASHLAEGKTDASVFTPGIGTVTGAAIPATGLLVGNLYNKFVGQQSALDKVASVWQDAAGATKSGINNMSKTAAKGLQENPEFLASAGILPETADENGRLVFKTGEDSEAYQTLEKRISGLAQLRDEALDHGPMQDLGEGMRVEYNAPTVNFEDLRKQMLDQAEKDFSGTAMGSAKSQINAEMDALKADPKYAINTDGEMSATQTSKIKTYLQGRANLDRPTQGLSAQIYDTMQGTAKKSVEDAAEASGNPNIRAINKIIQQHYDAQTFLKKINGQTIKGGRLGTSFKEVIGSAIGAAAAGAAGGGPVGTVLGGIAGFKGGEVASKVMQKLAAGGPFTAGTIGRMASEDPESVQQLLQYLGKDAGEKIAPVLQATQTPAADTVANIFKRSPGSVFRGMSRKATVFGTKAISR